MSVFDLPQQPDIRVDNVNARFMRVEALSGFQSDRFATTQLNFAFKTSSQVFWDPTKSYFRIRAKLVIPTGGGLVRAVTQADNIAPSQHFAAHLFSSLEYQLGGQTVSRVPQDVALAEAFFQRTSKSGGWIKQIGSSINFMGSFPDRQALVSSNALSDVYIPRKQLSFAAAATAQYAAATSRITFSQAITNDPQPIVGDQFLCYANETGGAVVVGGPTTVPIVLTIVSQVTGFLTTVFVVSGGPPLDFKVTDAKQITLVPSLKPQSASNFECCWQAQCLSINNLPHGLPGGEHRFILTPNQSYLTDAVETPGEIKTTAQYTLSIQEIVYYAYLVQSPMSFDDVKYSLNLSDVLIQRLDHNGGASQTSKIFTIPANTRSIAVGFQGRNTGTGTSRAQLTISDAASTPPFRNAERNLKRFYIQYRGKQWPSPDGDMDMTLEVTPAQARSGDSKNWLTKVYLDTMINAGLYGQSGGAESLAQFMDNGFYFLYEVAGDMSDNSTSLVVNYAGLDRLCDVVVFAISDTSRLVSGKDGRVIAIETSSTLGQVGSGHRYAY